MLVKFLIQNSSYYYSATCWAGHNLYEMRIRSAGAERGFVCAGTDGAVSKKHILICSRPRGSQRRDNIKRFAPRELENHFSGAFARRLLPLAEVQRRKFCNFRAISPLDLWLLR